MFSLGEWETEPMKHEIKKKQTKKKPTNLQTNDILSSRFG